MGEEVIRLGIEPHRWRAWCIGVLVGAAMVGSAQGLYRMARGVEQLEESVRVRDLQRSLATPEVRGISRDAELAWSQVRSEFLFPWSGVFLALETTTSADVTLLGFEPDKATNRLVLRGEASSNRALVDFMENLSRKRVLQGVYLRHQMLRRDGAIGVVEFELGASVVGE